MNEELGSESMQWAAALRMHLQSKPLIYRKIILSFPLFGQKKEEKTLILYIKHMAVLLSRTVTNLQTNTSKISENLIKCT